jgi:1-deoxy-D-xylulose-5-phosphate reductoisomerase
MKKIGILGSTGSIGTQALDIIKSNNNFEVSYLSAYSNIELLVKQTKYFKPKAICIVDKTKTDLLSQQLSTLNVEIFSGEEGLKELSCRDNIDLMLNALVGYSGMIHTFLAAEKGINIALANKESLVVAGKIITDKIKHTKSKLLPVDSEHSAIWQCLEGEDIHQVNKLILTGSGGPFRTMDITKFKNITKNEALKHPNWSMGSKITIDSATMMNKGLEVIEACWLFDIAIKNIDIVVHPQSIIHSMVEFIDGSIKAQLGKPTMNIPIHYALNYPKRTANDTSTFDFLNSPDLTFEKPDLNKFKCIKLAYQAFSSGDSYPIVLNVANDLCVAAFLSDKIKFIDIPSYIEDALEVHNSCNINNIDAIFNTIQSTQKYIKNKIGNN